MCYQHNGYSWTKILYGRVNPSDSLKINLNCQDGPSERAGKSFGMIPPPPGVATVVLVNFDQKSLPIKLNSSNSVPRSCSAPRRNDLSVRV